MIKRYEIRPRRKRTGSGNGGDAASAVEPQVPAESAAGAVPPAVVFDEK
jgi:hypothetical protein